MSAASPSPAPLFVLRGHRAPIHTLTFSRSFDVAGAGTSVAVRGGRGASASVAHGLSLLSGDSTGCVRLWNLDTRRSVASIAAHTMPVLAVHALEEGKIITSDGCDTTRDKR
jgi:WD40 repeat protein